MEDERQPFLAQTALLKGVLDHTRWNSARRSVILLALLLVGLIGYSLSVMMCADKDTSHLVASRLRDILGSIAPYDLPVPQSSLNEPSNTCTANNLSHPAMIPKHCQLVHFQLLARHGTRNPVVSQMQKLQTLEEELMLNKQSSSQWPQWLTDWRNPYNSSNVDQLVKQGVLDLQGLARRDICRYGQWINGKREGVGNNDNPDIRHQFASYASSEKQRCIDSASAYASIFSNRSLTLSDIHIVPRNKDPLLVPHHSCPRWEQLALNLTDLEAMKKPYIDQYSPAILMELTKRLGFSVTFKVYEYMILACSFEFAIKGHANGWCELLLDEDASRNDHYSVDPYSVESRALELHDFLQDIRFYHRYGLGKPLNARISCVLILQLLREMQEAVHGNLSTRWRLRFAHAETVLLLLTNLGINTDKPEFRRDRSLRASRLIPFAANMHFELLSCSSTPGTTQDEQYFVRVLLNEHPLQIPGCTDKEALCSWAQFQRIVQTHAGDCNYNAMCAAQ